jgi:hypothetical protein
MQHEIPETLMGMWLAVGKTVVKGRWELPQCVHEACDITGNNVKRGHGKSLTLGPTSW